MKFEEMIVKNISIIKLNDFSFKAFLEATEVSERRRLAAHLAPTAPSYAIFVNNDPMSMERCTPMQILALHGDLQRLQCLPEDNMAADDNYALRLAAANGHLSVVKYLLSNQKVRQKIDVVDNDALRLAIENKHSEVVTLLLSYASVFAFAEMRPKYQTYAHLFMTEKMSALRLANAVDLNPEEARLCFYMLRHLIRRNDSALLDDIRFLLEVPAVKNLAAKAVSRCQPNELVQLAHKVGNQGAESMLIAIPEVRRQLTITGYDEQSLERSWWLLLAYDLIEQERRMQDAQPRAGVSDDSETETPPPPYTPQAENLAAPPPYTLLPVVAPLEANRLIIK